VVLTHIEKYIEAPIKHQVIILYYFTEHQRSSLSSPHYFWHKTYYNLG